MPPAKLITKKRLRPFAKTHGKLRMSEKNLQSKGWCECEAKQTRCHDVTARIKHSVRATSTTRTIQNCNLLGNTE
jgi:hypothetical protein